MPITTDQKKTARSSTRTNPKNYSAPPTGGNRGTDYGASINSTKGNLTVGGNSYTSLDYEGTMDALRHMEAWRDERGLTTKNSRAEVEKLRAQANTLYPQYQMQRFQEMMAEYMAGMGEYIGAMTEAMNKVEPAAEPLKQAAQEMGAAKADTERKQLLRRGLMSTYTRYGQTGGTQKLGA
jgi:hypothetical protein